MQTIAFSDLRAHLADTLRQLQTSDQPICISQRGQPAAVLMSVAQYQRLHDQVPDDPWLALTQWRSKHALDLAAWAQEGGEHPLLVPRDPDPDGGRTPFAWPDDDESVGNLPAAAA